VSGRPSAPPISDAHLRLGRALAAVRIAAGISTRNVPKPGAAAGLYNSGHISWVEHGRTPPSRALVEQYVAMPGDNAHLRSLYLQMLAATREASHQRSSGGQGGVGRPPDGFHAGLSRTDVQEHYLVSRHLADYQFAPNGAIESTACAVDIRAKHPGVTLYYAGFNYTADPRRGVLDVSAEDGCKVVAVQESDSGAIACFFALERTIDPSDRDPYTVRFRVDVASSVPAAPRLRFHATEGNETLELSARFTSPACPRGLSRFATADVIDAEHPRNQHPVTLGSDGVGHHVFEHLVPGWVYGFRWSW